MTKVKAKQPATSEITEEEMVFAARRAFTFLSTCVDGQVADATVSDRITAARTLLEHADRVPRLMNQLMAGVDELSGEDLELIAGVVE